MLAFVPDAKTAAAAQGLPEALVFSTKESCMQLAKEVRSGCLVCVEGVNLQPFLGIHSQ